MYIANANASDAVTRDSIGGHPFLPAGTPWPRCPNSGKPMVLFFQLDVRPEFGIALAAGSHLAVFMSPVVNEIDTFDQVRSGEELPPKFWESRLPHFKIFVFDPAVALVAHADADPYLVAKELTFEETDDPSDPFLFLGGEPRWYQDPETHPGFEFIGQLSENYPFEKRAEAASQPGSFSNDDYCLFLGNSIYLFARAKPTDSQEVWVTLQN